MDFWNRSAEKLPVGKPARESINYLHARIAEHTGDLRAYSHVQLYKIYFTLAEEKPLLSRAFRRLARYHLEEALVWMKVLPEPLAILGPLQMQEGDLWGGIETISRFVEKQHSWMQYPANSKDSDRLELCRQLALGASARSKLCQFAPALQWFNEALETFKKIDPEVRHGEIVIEDTILVGIAGCLILEFRHPDAQSFIDSILADKVFAASQSSAWHSLVASRELLAGLMVVTRDFQPLPAVGELWGSLMEEIQRCATPEATREVRRKILSAIKIHEVNRQIRYLTQGIEKAIEQQKSMLQNVQPPPVTSSGPNTSVDLSRISDPEMRKQLENMTQATDAVIQESQRAEKSLNETIQLISEVAQRLGQRNLAKARSLADDVYHIPFRYQAEWLWWKAVRFVVQIIAVSYFLEKVFDKFLEKRGASLFEAFNFSRRELILPALLLLIGFVLGHVVEKKIDEWALSRYKHLLSRMVADRASKLWTTYNILLKVLAQLNQGLSDLKKQRLGLPSEEPA